MTAHVPALSLLTAYRGRPAYLQVLLRWLERVRTAEGFTDFEFILVEGAREATAAGVVSQYDWVVYQHLLIDGAFHKTALLNHAASLARGNYLMIYDVDWLPAEGVLPKHLSIATVSPACLVAGYRLQLPEILAVDNMPTARELRYQMSEDDVDLICSEDDYGAFLSHVLLQNPFGIAPCFPTSVFRTINGLDEAFVGWGPEDEDLIERACKEGLTLVRAFDLIYFHLPHEYEADWFNRELIDANRKRREQSDTRNG